MGTLGLIVGAVLGLTLALAANVYVLPHIVRRQRAVFGAGGRPLPALLMAANVDDLVARTTRVYRILLPLTLGLAGAVGGSSVVRHLIAAAS